MKNSNDRAAGSPPAADIERRRFLTWVTGGLGTLAGAIVGLPLIGYVVAPLLEKVPRAWRQVGPQDKFEIGKTVLVAFADESAEPWSGVTARTGAWLRRTGENDFIAFSINCTHLGCPVRWEAQAELFMCPCHGGVYYWDGVVAAGPPPLPLRRYPVRIRANQVEIRTSPLPIT